MKTNVICRPRAPGASLRLGITTAPRGLDASLLIAVLSLLTLGVALVYSASAVHAASRYGNRSYFLWRQILFTGIGLAGLYAGWRIDYRSYRRWTYAAIGITLLMLGLLFVPGIGTRVDGATRWFRWGILSFQPSELAKFVLVLYLAHSLCRKGAQLRLFSVGFLPHLLIAGLFALLIVKEPDLGSAATIVALTLIMLFVAGTRISYLLLSLLVSAPIVYHLIVGTPWRLRRMIAFLDPWSHRYDAGYQISESLMSVGSGGVWGLGLGAGRQKLFFLPAAHTDFIFALAGEELGLIGIVLILALFLLIFLRGARAALGATELFGTYLALGITVMISLQAILHMAVVLGLVPTKGIALPFISYGGTSLVVNLFAIGVVLNISARYPAGKSAKTDQKATTARWGRRNRKRPPRLVAITERGG